MPGSDPIATALDLKPPEIGEPKPDERGLKMMLDTKHIPQANRLPGEKRANKKLKRATNWEIHPITALSVCTKSETACDHGTGWEAVP